MMWKRVGLWCGIFLFGGLLQHASAAGLLTGTFNVSGTINVTGFSTITWNSDQSPFTASMFTLSASNLSVGGVPTASENGQNGIATLNNPPESVDSGGFTPTSFVTFLVAAGLPALDIDYIYPGTGGTAGCPPTTAAVNETCTLAGSLFTFTDDSASTSDAKFDLSGITSDGLSSWNGIFTSQFNETYQSLLAGFGPSSLLTNSFSGTVTITGNSTPITSIPEPATWLLVGLGLCAVVVLHKYRPAKLT
jgi:hypothetical protein